MGWLFECTIVTENFLKIKLAQYMNMESTRKKTVAAMWQSA